MAPSINSYQHIFFIGVAGAGMSAIAQYLAGTGKEVSGSDRYFVAGEVKRNTKQTGSPKALNVFLQNGDGITNKTQLVVVSTAIEDTVAEVQKAKALNIPHFKKGARYWH
jgi:UDP-N-acetylmuramate--alanine ligase